MGDHRIRERDIELLALRALAGERVPLLLGGRRYTLVVDPIYRIEDGGDGFLFLCCGLPGLKQRLDALAGVPERAPRETVSKLGGARGSH